MQPAEYPPKNVIDMPYKNRQAGLVSGSRLSKVRARTGHTQADRDTDVTERIHSWVVK